MLGELESIVVFVRVIETGSFAAAARSLRMAPGTVSKHVARLEQRLGFPVISRSTHRLHLTESGSEFFRRCQRSLLDIRDAEASARDVYSGVLGTLRIHVTPGIGQRLIEPAVVEFSKSHKDLRINLSVSPEWVNPLDRGLDIVFRSGASDDDLMRHASLGFREFGQLRYLVCAKKEYLQVHGRPSSPQDLIEHNCLVLSTQASARKWWFRGPSGDYPVAVRGNLVSNSHSAIIESMRSGLGIARILTFARDAKLPGVETFFDDLVISNRIVRAFFPRAERVPAKVEAYLDFFDEWFQTKSQLRSTNSVLKSRPHTSDVE